MKSKGFTIIELIVVIAIIAVLAGIVTSNVVSYIGRARDAKVKANVSQIAKQMQIYYAEHNTLSGYSLPSGIEGVDGFNASPTSNAFVIYGKLQSGQYWAQDSIGIVGTLTNPPNTNVYVVQEGSGALCNSNSDCAGSNNSCFCSSNRCTVCSSGNNCTNNSCDTVCVPNCSDKCGGVDDGCGGQCNDCPTGYHCTEQATCEQDPALTCQGNCNGCSGLGSNDYTADWSWNSWTCNYWGQNCCSQYSGCGWEGSCVNYSCSGSDQGSCGSNCPDGINCLWQ